MLDLLLLITIAFMVINLVMARYDYMHPSFLFSAVFFVYTLVCVICRNTYAITLHAPTVLVVTAGLTVFTMVGFFSRALRERTHGNQTEQPMMKGQALRLKPIQIPNILTLVVIVLQLIAIFSFIVYLENLTVVFNTTKKAAIEGYVSTTSLSEQINLFDTLTKFWSSTFREMSVPVPMAYRICNPLTSAASYLILYVMIHNFVANRSIHVLQLVTLALTCVLILLNGSRSPLFRILTMALMLFYILNIRHGRKREGDPRFLVRMVLIVLIAGAGFIMLLNFMGRTDDTSAKVGRYIFIYTGAPLVNLDTYLTNSVIGFKEGIPGAQTFSSLYGYLGKILHTDMFVYKGIGEFAFSSNGIEIGNVYTMFYKIIYDFGYAGVIPLTMLQALFYVLLYDHIVKGRVRPKPVSFGLFIYAYLFNDLIMSAFSARFYETALEAPFLKLFLLAWLYDLVFFRRYLVLGRYRVQLTAANYRRKKHSFVMSDRGYVRMK